MAETPAPATVSAFLLRARQIELEAARRLAGRIELVELLGQLIHTLQRERGASSLFLATPGDRYAALRRTSIEDGRPAERQLRRGLQQQLDPAQAASPQMLSLIAWVLLGLDSLEELRGRIDRRALTAHDGVTAFSRLIAGLLELTFEIAGAVPLPSISRQMVALLHLAQGGELAGQERAVGAELFASGIGDAALQQRVGHLIDAQERSLAVFAEYADADLRLHWEQLQLAPAAARLERLRRSLCTPRSGTAVDPTLSDLWFEVTSERISEFHRLQGQLTAQLRQACADHIRQAEKDLADSADLLDRLQQAMPRHVDAVGRFFDVSVPSGQAPRLVGTVDPVPAEAAASGDPSLLDLLQTQAARLADLEAQLEAARRTLNERKIVERAKGALMSRLGLSEDEAFRALQKTSMDQNRKLVDVALATLSLPDFAFGPAAAGTRRTPR